MEGFIYTAWFRDPAAAPGDQDREWPACFRVIADTIEAALAWGDELARERAARVPPAVLLLSEAAAEHAAPGAGHALPTVADGQRATDEYIGW